MRKDNAMRSIGRLELWGGLECTVNRAGDDYFSQMARNGHISVSPTYVPAPVHVCLDLLVDHETGIWHLTNGQPVTWVAFALQAAHLAGIDASRLEPCSFDHLDYKARRPAYSALGSARAVLLPTLESALARYRETLRLGACDV